MTSEEQWDSEKAAIVKLVDECVAKLGEHIDVVHILVCHGNANKTTMTYEKGCGNFHARLGMIFEWLEVQKQYQRNWAIRKEEEKE